MKINLLRKLFIWSLFIMKISFCMEFPKKSLINLEELQEASHKTNIKKQQEEFDERLVPLILQDFPNRLGNYLSLSKSEFDKTFPKASMFVGMPGVGKTTLARGIAIKYGYSAEFVQCSLLANEYKNSGVQEIIRKVKPLLLDKNPSLVIFDEISVLIDKHANKNDADKDMAVALWQLMDELKYSPHKIIATANDLKEIPGPLKSRFGNWVFEIPLPSEKTRVCIARYYLDKKNINYLNEIPKILAKKTRGLSGRDIENLIDLTAESAIFRLQKTVSFSEPEIIKQDVDYAVYHAGQSLKLLENKISYKQIVKDGLKSAAPFIVQNVLHMGLTLYLNNKQMAATEESLELTRQQLKLAQETHNKQFSQAEHLKASLTTGVGNALSNKMVNTLWDFLASKVCVIL